LLPFSFLPTASFQRGRKVVSNHAKKQIPLRTAIFPVPFYLPNPRQNMADAANKYPENVPGQFYVDDQCIDCDLCRETAPANFKRNDDGGHSYVYKQAENPDEEAKCKEAMEGCPVEAIGNDGA
jgi:ferredoxin